MGGNASASRQSGVEFRMGRVGGGGCSDMDTWIADISIWKERIGVGATGATVRWVGEFPWNDRETFRRPTTITRTRLHLPTN